MAEHQGYTKRWKTDTRKPEKEKGNASEKETRSAFLLIIAWQRWPSDFAAFDGNAMASVAVALISFLRLVAHSFILTSKSQFSLAVLPIDSFAQLMHAAMLHHSSACQLI